MSCSPSRVALLFQRRADLRPPLGYPGGSCHVIDRIQERVKSPGKREDLIQKVEMGDKLTNQDANVIYDYELDRGARQTRFRAVVMTPHAQYRMDQRGITVGDILTTLMAFHKKWSKEKSRDSSIYQDWESKIQRGQKIEWTSQGLTVVFEVATVKGKLAANIITVFEDKANPRPQDREDCKGWENWEGWSKQDQPELSRLEKLFGKAASGPVLTVYRTHARGRDTLSNTNAADLKGVANWLERAADLGPAQPRGDFLTRFVVQLSGSVTDEYAYFRRGVGGVGDTVGSKSMGGGAWYSFPEGGGWKVRSKKSVSLGAPRRRGGEDPKKPGVLYDERGYIREVWWKEGLGAQEKFVKRMFASGRGAGSGGDCYEANGRYFMDKSVFPGKDKKLRLVHGEVCGSGPLEGVSYGHAWIEDGSTVIDVSNGRNLRLPKAVYYKIGCIDQIGNTKSYKPEEFRKKVMQHEHWGPWDLKTSTGL